MPAMTINRINGANSNGEIECEVASITSEKQMSVNTSKTNTDALMDLLGFGEEISSPTIQAPTTTVPAAANNILDLLGDIELSTSDVPVTNNNNNVTSHVTMSILDDNENAKIPDGSMFNINGSSGAQSNNYDLGLDFLSTTSSTGANTITAFDKNDLLVTLSSSRHSDFVQIIMTATNNSLDTLEQYLFQVCLFYQY
jgi:hypothetical protein